MIVKNITDLPFDEPSKKGYVMLKIMLSNKCVAYIKIAKRIMKIPIMLSLFKCKIIHHYLSLETSSKDFFNNLCLILKKF